MTTLTDKELIKEIRERIGSLDVRDNIERRAYEIALASLEAEAPNLPGGFTIEVCESITRAERIVRTCFSPGNGGSSASSSLARYARSLDCGERLAIKKNPRTTRG
ncbi:TPA: hypothetical protein KEX94_004834 [Escherichia coli]|nr:hypothetical protein [Escherichia coli]